MDKGEASAKVLNIPEARSIAKIETAANIDKLLIASLDIFSSTKALVATTIDSIELYAEDTVPDKLGEASVINRVGEAGTCGKCLDIFSSTTDTSEALDTAMENLKQQKHYKFNQLKTKNYLKHMKHHKVQQGIFNTAL